MFDFLDFAAVENEVNGQQYEKDVIVNFTIKEVKVNQQYKSFTVVCADENDGKFEFKFGGDRMSAGKKKTMVAFLTAFFSRDDLISKKANPVELVGQRFEAKSEGVGEYEGKKFQKWTNTFRKLDATATPEEFMQ